jgi:hypothetical protein
LIAGVFKGQAEFSGWLKSLFGGHKLMTVAPNEDVPIVVKCHDVLGSVIDKTDIKNGEFVTSEELAIHVR